MKPRKCVLCGTYFQPDDPKQHTCLLCDEEVTWGTQPAAVTEITAAEPKEEKP